LSVQARGPSAPDLDPEHGPSRHIFRIVDFQD
jgi:hypothetical protein